ncbi:MAG: ABC transporter substrate-binding protein [Actinobacteria bacterium HGW-Actinobacteria-7]|jgi:osmoprotectant transport system substrate-binding protein|nr:MAG: ABC transporter substrate-binding protein [Actinobacteria bacterium HGW-Actinobacteria-7]
MKRTFLLALAAFSVAAIVLGGCATKPPAAPVPAEPAKKDVPAIKVGSLLDSEGAVLGSMVIQMLDANGFETVDKTKLGTPDVVRKALLEGEVDATIDYTGSGQFYIAGQEGLPVWNDAKGGYDTIAKLDKEQNNLVWLAPAPANNTELVCGKTDFLTANNIVTMADFAKYVNDGGKTKVICSQTWADKVGGLPSMEKAYGFKLTKSQIIPLSDGVTAQMLKAVAEGTDGVNFSLAYGTDGQLADLGLTIIEDPKSVPPVYEPTPIFRGEIIDAAPEIPGILNPIFETLDQATLQKLNAEVAFAGKDPKVVAKEYLVANGFLK